MVDRAAGRSPAVRTATPHLAPAFTSAADSLSPHARVNSELTPAPVPVVAAPAAPSLAPPAAAAREHAPAAREHTPAARVTARDLGEPARGPLLGTHVEDERIPSLVAARDPVRTPEVSLVAAPREPAPVAPPVAEPRPRVTAPSAAITAAASEPPLVSLVDETPLATKLVAPTSEALVGGAAPREAVAAEAERITPPRPRVMRATPALPKLDLRQALDAVGRALAEPPRPRPAPARAESASEGDHEDVHITIGHIDVRATTLAPVGPTQPARRAPSITLAEYLRRTPGSPR